MLTHDDVVSALVKDAPPPPPRGRTLEQLNAETELARYFARARVTIRNRR